MSRGSFVTVTYGQTPLPRRTVQDKGRIVMRGKEIPEPTDRTIGDNLLGP